MSYQRIDRPGDYPPGELFESNNSQQCETCGDDIDLDDDPHVVINGKYYHLPTHTYDDCRPICDICDSYCDSASSWLRTVPDPRDNAYLNKLSLRIVICSNCLPH